MRLQHPRQVKPANVHHVPRYRHTWRNVAEHGRRNQAQRSYRAGNRAEIITDHDAVVAGIRKLKVGQHQWIERRIGQQVGAILQPLVTQAPRAGGNHREGPGLRHISQQVRRFGEYLERFALSRAARGVERPDLVRVEPAIEQHHLIDEAGKTVAAAAGLAADPGARPVPIITGFHGGFGTEYAVDVDLRHVAVTDADDMVPGARHGIGAGADGLGTPAGLPNRHPENAILHGDGPILAPVYATGDSAAPARRGGRIHPGAPGPGRSADVPTAEFDILAAPVQTKGLPHQTGSVSRPVLRGAIMVARQIEGMAVAGPPAHESRRHFGAKSHRHHRHRARGGGDRIAHHHVIVAGIGRLSLGDHQRGVGGSVERDARLPPLVGQRPKAGIRHRAQRERHPGIDGLVLQRRDLQGRRPAHPVRAGGEQGGHLAGHQRAVKNSGFVNAAPEGVPHRVRPRPDGQVGRKLKPRIITQRRPGNTIHVELDRAPVFSDHQVMPCRIVHSQIRLHRPQSIYRHFAQ